MLRKKEVSEGDIQVLFILCKVKKLALLNILCSIFSLFTEYTSIQLKRKQKKKRLTNYPESIYIGGEWVRDVVIEEHIKRSKT